MVLREFIINNFKKKDPTVCRGVTGGVEELTDDMIIKNHIFPEYEKLANPGELFNHEYLIRE